MTKIHIAVTVLRNFYFQVLLVRINIFKGLIATFNVLLHRCIFTAASSKFVTDAVKGCIHVCGDGKRRKIQPRSVEHNFRHKAVVLMVTLKNIMLKFWSIMYLTLRRVLRGQLFIPKGKFNYLKVFSNLWTLFFQYV